jgi:hypothetical protein
VNHWCPLVDTNAYLRVALRPAAGVELPQLGGQRDTGANLIDREACQVLRRRLGGHRTGSC